MLKVNNKNTRTMSVYKNYFNNMWMSEAGCLFEIT